MKRLVGHATAAPVLALMFASAVNVGFVLAYVAWTGRYRYGFLGWNLFLAWLPLIFSLLAFDVYHEGARKSWRFFGLCLAWLLFFPNAPYIFTDLIHLATRYYGGPFWVDMLLVLSCAITGLVLGFVSLYLMQTMVTRMLGRALGWLFIVAVAGLSGFGVYLGRFARLNSWDVLLKPVGLYHGLNSWAADPLGNKATFLFPLFFAAFLFLAYVVLYALTHLPRGFQPPESRASLPVSLA